MKTESSLPDQRVWSVGECVTTFTEWLVTIYLFQNFFSVLALRERQLKEEGELVWDKDNPIDLDFVVAAANLRSYVFGISLKSKFDIKCEYHGNHYMIFQIDYSHGW